MQDLIFVGAIVFIITFIIVTCVIHSRENYEHEQDIIGDDRTDTMSENNL